MGHFYSATVPDSGKSRLSSLSLAFPPALPPLTRDRIQLTLRRRLAACRERRREAALSPGNDEDFQTWKRETARSEKLCKALLKRLCTHRPSLTLIPEENQP